jgi:hypothetical protein
MSDEHFRHLPDDSIERRRKWTDEEKTELERQMHTVEERRPPPTDKSWIKMEGVRQREGRFARWRRERRERRVRCTCAVPLFLIYDPVGGSPARCGLCGRIA